MASALVGGWAEYQRFRKAFHELLDPELYPAAWLDGEVACERMHLFCSDSSAMLCSVKSYPSGLKEVHAEAAVGKLGEIANLIPFIETWARAHGCKAASVQSREGWVRVLQRFGYGHYQTTLRKAL